MKPIRTTLMAISVLSLAACASKDKLPQLDYQTNQQKQVRLDVPPDLTNPDQGNRYSIPAGSGAVRASDLQKGGPVTAANQQVLAKVEKAHIEREGSQRWLVVEDKTPAQLWPLLKVFWQEMGFVVATEEPQIGMMETEWAENRAKLPNDGIRRLFEKVGLGSVYSTSERDKFIIRLERAGNGSRVVFAHKGMAEVYTSKAEDNTVWQPRPSDANLEAAFLGRFMQRLGADEAEVTRQLTQQGTAGELAKLDGNSVLVMGDGERNWRRIGLALDRIGLTVIDQNPNQRAYLVQVAQAETTQTQNSKPGLLSRWFGGSKKTTEPAQKAQLVVALQAVKGGDRVVLLNPKDGSPYTGSDLNRYLSNLHIELR